MNRLTTLSLATSLLFNSCYLFANEAASSASLNDAHINSIISHSQTAETELIFDLGWDTKYISEGRNNLDNGGIYWATTALQYDDLTLYTTVGRGDSHAYIEWNLGFEYGVTIGDALAASVGYQHLRGYGDLDCSDNELFASLSYITIEWLTPSIAYTYSTAAAGYFIEASLRSPWQLTEKLTLIPYITQAFDFQYATEAHNGSNHFQFGIEAEYPLPSQLVLSGHISHTIAQADIKQEHRQARTDLDQTYMGLHLTWSF
jgi:hypothetical protein